MDMGDLLDRSVALYRENLVPLLGVYAVGYVPFWLLVGLAAHSLSGAFLTAASTATSDLPAEAAVMSSFVGAFMLFLVIFAAVIVLEPIVSGAMARAVADRLLGQPTSVRSAYAALHGRRGALILASLIRLMTVYGAANILSLPAMMVTGMAMERASLLSITAAIVLDLGAIVVGSCIFMYLAFLGQIIVVEQRGLGDALSRSWRLVSGRLWRSSAIAAFLTLLVLALTAACQAPLVLALAWWGPLQPTPQAVAATTTLLIATIAVSTLLASPVLAIGSTLMYFDLRVRKEGLDVEMLAANTGRLEGAG
jgi:hypothetical protein